MKYIKNLSILSLSLYILNVHGMEQQVDKFALLKSRPLDQVTVINVPPGHDLTEQNKRALVLSLCAADDAVTVDTTHSAFPLTVDAAKTWFGLETATPYSSEDESREDSVLTIMSADGQPIAFTEKALRDNLGDLCDADSERIVVVNTQTIHHKVGYFVPLTAAEKNQLRRALLSSNAQDGAANDGTYIIDIARLQPLPNPVHDLVYGAQQQTAPASQWIIRPKSTITDRLFNKTTLSACAVCAVAAWVAAKQLGQSSE